MIILIGPHLDAGLVHRHEQERDALVLGHVGVGAGQHEDPVGEVAGRGPDLLAVDHPLVAVELGPAAEVAEVGAGVGLAVALAPEVLAREDARQEVRLLLVGAPLAGSCCRPSGCRTRRCRCRPARRPCRTPRPGSPARARSARRRRTRLGPRRGQQVVGRAAPCASRRRTASASSLGERADALPVRRAGARRGRPGSSRGTPRLRRCRSAPWRRG